LSDLFHLGQKEKIAMSLSPPEPNVSASALPWHAETPESVPSRLAVDPVKGLAVAEAQARFQRHGPNRLAEPAPRPVWLKFLDQFRSFISPPSSAR
jgi:Ca2+-transporting ATPase